MTRYAEIALVRGLSWLADAQATIANNLANIDTSGFKRRSPVAVTTAHDFDSVLGRLSSIGFQEHLDWRPGHALETGNRLDVALGSDTFFRVQDADGRVFYTRDGQMSLDRDGRLVNRNGLLYLDQAGKPIPLSEDGAPPADFAIAPNGQISAPGSGRTWGPIGIWRLPDAAALRPVGRGLFHDVRDQRPQLLPDGAQQGYREASNVDSLQELVQMIIVQRSFAATQRAMTGIGRMQDHLIQNVSR